MTFNWTTKHLKKVRKWPHLIGHLIGKTKLTKLHSKWIREVWESKANKALQAHRGAYKTTAIAVVGVIWWLLFHPEDRIAIVRKRFTDAAEILSTIRQAFELPELISLFQYAHGFAPVAIKHQDRSLRFNFKKTITPEGSIDAYGTETSITGKHYDVILCDDFVTVKDRLSRAERLRTDSAILEIIANIIDPGKHCIFTGTPWQKNDSWRLVPKPILYDVHSTGILSAAEIEDKKKKTTRSLYSCNYELKHVADENKIFTEPIYEPWDWKFKPVYAQLDAKYGGDCFGALTIMAKRPDNLIQSIGWVFEDHVKTKIKWIVEKCVKHRVKKIYTENNADKGYTADLLKGEGLSVGDYDEKTNKHIKIISYLKNYWTDLRWSPDTDDEYMVHTTDYAEGEKPDDAPDSAASLLREGFYRKANDMALWE